MKTLNGFLKNYPSKKNVNNQIKVHGIVQPRMGKGHSHSPYLLVSEFGLFYLKANDKLLKFFNLHQWEEFIIKGTLHGNVLNVISAKLKMRPVTYIEQYLDSDDPVIYEQIIDRGVQLEPYFDEVA